MEMLKRIFLLLVLLSISSLMYYLYYFDIQSLNLSYSFKSKDESAIISQSFVTKQPMLEISHPVSSISITTTDGASSSHTSISPAEHSNLSALDNEAITKVKKGKESKSLSNQHTPNDTDMIFEWNSLSWVINQTMMDKYKDLQRRFLSSSDKTAFRPQPVIYRPILYSFGWGNMFYDITHNFLLAVILERPFIMSFDIKDPSGSIDFLLEPREIDWRYSALHHQTDQNESTSHNERYQHHHFESLIKVREFKIHQDFDLNLMQKDASSDRHEQVSCRNTHQWHAYCSRNTGSGNLDPIYPMLKKIPEKVLYSEYSESIIMPIRNSNTFNRFVDQNLSKIRRRWNNLSIPVRFVFNFLFRPSRFLRDSLLEVQARLGNDYIVGQVRTGHMEDSIRAGGEKTLNSILASLEDCKNKSGNRKWLLLTDDYELALTAKAKNISSTSFTEKEVSDSQAGFLHTGKAIIAGGSKNDKQKAFKLAFRAWKLALIDWLLIAQAPSMIFLHNRVSSAGSFGSRAAYSGGHACSNYPMTYETNLRHAPSKELRS